MKAVADIEPMKVEVQDVEYPGLELKDGPGVNPANVGRQCQHGVILKCVSTNICGSDQHVVRGRTTAPPGRRPGPQSSTVSSRARQTSAACAPEITAPRS